MENSRSMNVEEEENEGNGNSTSFQEQVRERTGRILTREEFEEDHNKHEPFGLPKKVRVYPEDDFVVACPWCGDDNFTLSKRKVDCCVFRHGIFKHSSKQINPHAPERKCRELLESGKIVGCAKPFILIRVYTTDDKDPEKLDYYVQKCDYI